MVDLKRMLTKILENALIFRSNTDATVASQYANANIKTLKLFRYGKTVFATFVLEYVNGTTITPDTTIWTIPEGYRPSTTITRQVLAHRANSSTINSSIKATNVTINTNGTVSLATSNATLFYGTAVWQIE